ncbi:MULTISPECIES: hypothetical protein [unclassified Nocardioides]|uniref:hypothetical protein n=1 Tax=unclassified Nocardioides TaxID=2615069 RepID=UPI0030147898
MSATLTDAPVTRPASSPRPLRRRARSALVGATSLLVLLGGLLYVVAPATPTLDASFGEIAGDAPHVDEELGVEYSLAAAEVARTKRRNKQTFYGSVQSAGVPVSNARLVVKGVQKKTRRYRATVRIGRVGKAFRARTRLVPGRYRVTITLKAAGRTKSVSRTMTLRNNRSYRASVRVRESGIVTMLPVTSY